ncbi:MAG: hypothetical protein WDN03_10630 [Rhizomicrobium sp.]
MRTLAGIAVAVLALASAHAAPLGDADKAQIDAVILADTDDASFDAAFQCPEALESADARTDAFERYLTWAHLRHPDWNFKKRLDVRTGLLRRHGCTATLANVSASAQPAFALKP